MIGYRPEVCEACRKASKGTVSCGACKSGQQQPEASSLVLRVALRTFSRLGAVVWDGFGGINVQGIAAALDAFGFHGEAKGTILQMILDLAGTIIELKRAENGK